MKIRGIETFRPAFNMAKPRNMIGVLVDDENKEIHRRIQEAINNREKLFFVSPEDGRMMAAKRLIEELDEN